VRISARMHSPVEKEETSKKVPSAQFCRAATVCGRTWAGML
jgi:hypothetical protein